MMSMNVQISHNTPAVSAMYLFGSFRSSERKKLLAVSKDNKPLFISALEDFLNRWATADWLEEYNVERVGSWIAKNCDQGIQDAAMQRVNGRTSANPSVKASESVHERTYKAFESGLTSMR
jgi:hypothetical protein